MNDSELQYAIAYAKFTVDHPIEASDLANLQMCFDLAAYVEYDSVYEDGTDGTNYTYSVGTVFYTPVTNMYYPLEGNTVKAWLTDRVANTTSPAAKVADGCSVSFDDHRPLAAPYANAWGTTVMVYVGYDRGAEIEYRLLNEDGEAQEGEWVDGYYYYFDLQPGKYFASARMSEGEWTDAVEVTVDDWTKIDDLKLTQTAVDKVTVTWTGSAEEYYLMYSMWGDEDKYGDVTVKGSKSGSMSYVIPFTDKQGSLDV